MRITKTLFCAFAILLCSFSSAQAKSLKVTDIQNYFNTLNTLEAEFSQVDTSNITRAGKFYLLRPKKLRLDYHTHDQEQIFLSGSQFVYFNPVLDEVSYIPSSRVPISFLSKKIQFGSDVKILDFNQDKNSANIKIEVPLEKSEYVNVNLNFLKNPLKLNTITYNDLISGKTIIFMLTDQKVNRGISKKVFEFDNPHF